jgi:NitT/TauT family transport system substrate-binding protein
MRNLGRVSSIWLVALLLAVACAPPAPTPTAAPAKPTAAPAPTTAPAKPAEAPAPTAAAVKPAEKAVEKPAQAPGGQPTSLSFRNSFLPAMGYAQFWLAAKEYWPQLGLNVAVKPGQGDAQTVQAVASGADQVGFAGAFITMKSIQEGLPITMIMMVSRRDPTGLIFMQDSGIRTWKDLAGKRIGSFPAAAQQRQAMLTIAKKEGVTEDQMQLVNVDPPASVSQLLQKSIDGFTGFAWAQDVWMRCAGQAGATSLRFADYGFEVSGQAVIANTNWLRTAPEDVVTRFLLGVAQASTSMKQNPEHAFSVMKETNPEAVLDRAQQLAGMAKQGGYVRWQWDPDSRPFKEKGFGWIDSTEISQSQDRLVEAGLLTQKAEVEKYFTTKYLEDPAVKKAAMDFHTVPWGDIPADVKQQCGVE